MDLARRDLSLRGAPLHLGGRDFDVLALLVENHGRVVPRQELFEAVWKNAEVEPNSLDRSVSNLRKILGDTDKNHFIKTIPNQGFQFVAAVTKISTGPPATPLKSTILIRIAALILALSLVGSLWWSIRNRPAPPLDLAKSFFDKAIEYQRLGDDEQALSALNQAIASKNDYAEAYLEAASVYLDIGDNKKAREFAERARQLSKQLPPTLVPRLAGLLHEIAGEYEKAIQQYRLLIDLAPDQAENHLYFATIASHLGRLEEAEVALNRCLGIDPKNPFCQTNLMFLMLRKNDFAGVLRLHGNLQAGDIKYPWFHEPVGIAFWGMDDLQSATEHFRRLGDAKAGSVRVYGRVHSVVSKEWLADLLIYQGRISEASIRIRQLIDLSNDSEFRSGHLIYLARINALVGDRSTVPLFAQQALKESKDPRTLIAAAEVLALGNWKARADELLMKARGVPALDSERITEVEHLNRGISALSGGLEKMAIQELGLADEAGDDLEVQFVLAKALMAATRWDEAIVRLHKIRESKGRILVSYTPALFPLTAYNLGVSYEHKGLDERAVQSLSEFLAAWSSADQHAPEVRDAASRRKAILEKVRPRSNEGLRLFP